MASSARSLLGYMFKRGARHRRDQRTVAEHAWPDRHDLPAGLELEWLGTAGFRFAYRGTQVVIDPYLTRCPVSDLILRRAVTPRRGQIARHLAGKVDAILMGHTHFDHAIDVPTIAAEHGCNVYGSRSMLNLMSMYDLADQAIEVEPYATYEVGPFAITFVPSAHSKLILGLAVPYRGDISGADPHDLTPTAYCVGQVYAIHIEVAGVSFYHQGSAEVIEDNLRHHGVDYFLACVSGRGFSTDYFARVLPRLEPRVIIPHHYDDFFRTLDEPMRFSPNIDMAGFVAEVDNVAPGLEIRTLGIRQTVAN